MQSKPWEHPKVCSPKAGSRICCWPREGLSNKPSVGGRGPLQEPQCWKIPECQEFGLIRPRRAGRYQAPSGLEMEPGHSRCSHGPATSKGSNPCPSHASQPSLELQGPSHHSTSMGSTRNRSHRDTRLVNSAVTTTPQPCFPWKIHKKLLKTMLQAQGKSPTLATN